MGSEMVAKKRGAHDICAAMLDVLEEDVECGRASLAIRSNIDSRALGKYLPLMLQYGLVEKATGTRHSSLRICPKGKEYLILYAKMVALLD